jgi:hypothetical protein
MGKAKLAGLIVDRKENGAPGDFANLSADERRAALEFVDQELVRRGLRLVRETPS